MSTTCHLPRAQGCGDCDKCRRYDAAHPQPERKESDTVVNWVLAWGSLGLVGVILGVPLHFATGLGYWLSLSLVWGAVIVLLAFCMFLVLSGLVGRDD